MARAPEFKDIDGWLNTKPLLLEGLRGKVVLLDFWTYSCVNCLRTLPHMKLLWEKYKKYPFVIVGVHTPEFDFERQKAHVEKAVKRLGIEYPVALDSRNTTWIAYGNQYWPKQILIDDKGIIVWEHGGEGDYDEMERQIVGAVQKAGVAVTENVSAREDDVASSDISPETYAGSGRNKGIGSSGVCTLTGCEYRDRSEHKRDVIYLQGAWEQEPEFLEYKGEDAKGYLAFQYRAREVNIVMEPVSNSVDVEVLLDGKTLVKDKSGSDVRVNGGKSTLVVDRADMYRVVLSNGVEEHEIRILSRRGLRVYAFTFG